MSGSKGAESDEVGRAAEHMVRMAVKVCMAGQIARAATKASESKIGNSPRLAAAATSSSNREANAREASLLKLPQ